jgi:hypothetical protein
MGILGILATALAAALVVVWTRQDEGRSQKLSLAQLAATNYRTFTPPESRRLVRYSEKEYACLVAHGAHISSPVVSRTRILMHAHGLSARRLVRYMEACDPKVGPPPLKATLQARPEQVLVYFPKRCLLDPNELP